MQHIDKNGVELVVGDIVRWGEAEGKVLILENWRAIGPHDVTAGVYVSDIGYWGDCRAVPARDVEKVTA